LQQLFLTVFKKYNNKFYLFDLCNIIKPEFNYGVYMNNKSAAVKMVNEILSSTGLTYKELAVKTGINFTTLWRIENASHTFKRLSDETENSIATYFNSSEYLEDINNYRLELMADLKRCQEVKIDIKKKLSKIKVKL
jgi:transcriptional regulator with XRE-family HTH domain